MKKVKGLVSVLLSASLMFSLAACTEKETYSDYYTFDTGSIAGELLYGSSMKIEPVIRNLGEVVDADYNVKVTFDGQDVTSSVYNAETKTFAPAEQADAIGLYTFTLTVVDEQGNEIEDDSGEAFSTSFTVDYCIMNFVPKASAGAGIDVNNDDPLSPVISFGENYTGEGLNDSGQYRVTGVNFSGDYEIVYKVKADARKGPMFAALLFTMMMPGIVMLIPSYIIYDYFYLTDTYFPLMVPAMFGSAACVFFLRQFFAGVPDEILDAAKLDGVGYVGIYWRIMLPLSVPALLAQAILGFVAGYNDYLAPLIYIVTERKYTLQIALQFFSGGNLKDLPTVMAGAVVAIIPTVLIYVFAQKYFVEGIAITGLKG